MKARCCSGVRPSRPFHVGFHYYSFLFFLIFDSIRHFFSRVQCMCVLSLSLLYCLVLFIRQISLCVFSLLSSTFSQPDSLCFFACLALAQRRKYLPSLCDPMPLHQATITFRRAISAAHGRGLSGLGFKLCSGVTLRAAANPQGQKIVCSSRESVGAVRLRGLR